MISPKGIEKANTRRGKRWVKRNPVGTGPFTFVKFERDIILQYKKFNGYWDKGRPYLDGIDIYFNQDPKAAVKSLTDGEAHVMRKISGRQALKLRENGFIIIDYPTGIKSIALDTANPASVYTDKRVREAIEYAINRKEIVDVLGHGFWHAVNQYSPRDSNGFNPDFIGRPYSPNEAKRLLAEAGYPVGFKTKIIASRNVISTDTLAEIIENLRRVGIHAVPDIVGAGKYFELQISGWKDSLMVFSHNIPMNITNQLNILFKSDAGQLPSVKRSPELEEVLKNARTTPDYATQKALTQKAVRMISESSMVIPLWSYNSIIATHPSVRDLGFGDSNGGLWTPDRAWLNE
jgi:ABC-type transport system substrate-binding protein